VSVNTLAIFCVEGAFGISASFLRHILAVLNCAEKEEKIKKNFVHSVVGGRENRVRVAVKSILIELNQ